MSLSTSLYETLMRSWAVEALTWSGVMMGAVLLLRRPAQRLFGARVAYALWALPALRLALPRIPGLVQRWRIEMGGAELYAAASVPAPELSTFASLHAGLAPAAVYAVPSAPAPAPTVDWPVVLLVLWLGGAALFLACQMLAHRRFLARAIARATIVQRDGGILVLAAPGVPGPLATGVFRRLILLPADFTRRYAPAERRLVLAHEVAHHCRGDLVANIAALLVLALHWFNPLAHRAYRAFRADQELACDETVLANEAGDARTDYGRAIVRTVARRAPVAACTMHAAGVLKRRLQMMSLKPRGLARLLAGALLGASLIGGGLALTASGTAMADPGAVTPTPPIPPAPPAPPAPLAPLTAPTPLAPLAPPAPPHLAARGHDVWIGRTDRHHVEVRDGRQIRVDGREVDPDSPEGERVLAQAADARREGERAAAEGRRAGERARLEGLRAAEEGRRAGEEAARAAQEGLRAGEQARRDAMRAGEEARREAMRAAFASRYAASASAQAARAVAMVDRRAIDAEVRRSLIRARDDIARSRDYSDRVRVETLRAIDAQIARLGDGED